MRLSLSVKFGLPLLKLRFYSGKHPGPSSQ